MDQSDRHPGTALSLGAADSVNQTPPFGVFQSWHHPFSAMFLNPIAPNARRNDIFAPAPQTDIFRVDPSTILHWQVPGTAGWSSAGHGAAVPVNEPASLLEQDRQPGSLILNDDLEDFSRGKLDQTSPPPFSSDDGDSSDGDVDLVKFHVSEDEFGNNAENSIDPYRSYDARRSVPDFPMFFEPTPVTSIAAELLPSSPPHPTESGDAEHDDVPRERSGQPPPFRDSMDDTFLDLAVEYSLTQPDPFTLCMKLRLRNPDGLQLDPFALGMSMIKATSQPPNLLKWPITRAEFGSLKARIRQVLEHHYGVARRRGMGRDFATFTAILSQSGVTLDFRPIFLPNPSAEESPSQSSSDHLLDDEIMEIGVENDSAENLASSTAPQTRPLLSLARYKRLHRYCEYSQYFIPPGLILDIFNKSVASMLLATPLAPLIREVYVDADGFEFTAVERNMTVSQFIRQWFVRSHVQIPPHGAPVPKPRVMLPKEAIHVEQWDRPSKVSRPESGNFSAFDIQAIPWFQKLRISREDARAYRDRVYKSYHNLKPPGDGHPCPLPSTENYFQPKALYTQHKASLEHFQLRNLMSVTASNTFQYASRSRVYSVIPFYDESYCVMDLSDPLSSDYFQDPVKITVMAAKHGVSFAGGFFGEYAYRADVVDNLLVEGAVNGESTSITTHVDIVKSRTNSNPQAVIATNDNVMRVLDFYTNTFIHTHQFAEPVNCSDTSTDGRMRVITGDAPDAWVIDAETGKPIGTLKGHTDYGFACVWSPDMLHIATSNQDKTVKIWDSRMWRLLDTLESDVAGYRSLRYSPVGGGPRTLLMCEPADRIAIVNAQTYQTRQVHDFFGEVGGADFSPDGGRIWVANMDPEFGGFMEFDRATWSEEFGIPRLRRSSVGSESEPFYRDSGTANEWLREDELEHDGRCVLGPGERGLRFQRTMSNFLHDIHPYSG